MDYIISLWYNLIYIYQNSLNYDFDIRNDRQNIEYTFIALKNKYVFFLHGSHFVVKI